MPTLDDVYRKFGEVSEAAQLLETELGSKLMFHAFVEKGISPTSLQVVDQKAAADLLSGINRQTLGQLIKNNKRHAGDLDQLEPLLSTALALVTRFR